MATNADIQWWLAQHPGASDATMRGAMNQSNVAPGQVARATGWDPSAVFQRYQAAGGMQSTPRYNAGDIQGWLAANPNATDEERRQAMLDHGVTTGDVADATGMNVGTVDQRFQAAGGDPSTGPMANTQAANTAPLGTTQSTSQAANMAANNPGGSSYAMPGAPPPIGNMGVSMPNPGTGSLGGYGGLNSSGYGQPGQSGYGLAAKSPYGVSNQSAYGSNALMQKMYPGGNTQAGGNTMAGGQNELMKRLTPGVPGVKNYLS